jgi:DNA-binding transcriptional LysR family regulator
MDPRKIDIRLLYTLEAIHRTGSLTVAGDILGLSQPALSHQLRRLREIFADELFIRQPEGMHATPKADELARSARYIQSTIRAELGVAASFDPQQTDRAFNLCMTDVGEMVLLPKLLRRLRAEAPHANVRIVSMSPREMTRALESGEADLALGPFPELIGASLKRQRLFDRGFLCLASENHPRIRETLSIEAYLSEPHLIISPSGRIEQTFDKFLAEQNLSRRIILSVAHMLSAPAVIRESDLIATVPQSVGLLFGSYAGVRALKLPFEPPIEPPRTTISQFWGSRFDKDPAIMWLRRIVADIFQKSDEQTLEAVLTG